MPLPYDFGGESLGAEVIGESGLVRRQAVRGVLLEDSRVDPGADRVLACFR